MRVNITLYSDDAERFQEVKQRIANQRNGAEPSNSEVVRLLMDETEDPGGLI